MNRLGSLLILLLSFSVNAEDASDFEFECIGGGVLIKYTGEGVCGTNSHAGFTCENPENEICNPFIFGVKPDGKPVCFKNAKTEICLSKITTGKDTVFGPVFNQRLARKNFNEEQENFKKVCEGNANINESSSAVNNICRRLNGQIERNIERKLRGYEPAAGIGFHPLENGPSAVERAQIREEIRNTELAIERVTEQNQTHDIQLPATYFKRDNGVLDRGAHRKFLDLYLRFKDKSELAGSHLAMQRALAFFARNRNGIPSSCGGDMGEARSPNDGKQYPAVKKIENQRYVVFVDYTISHPEDRLFILDLETGDVKKSPAAHGYGSNRPGCPKGMEIGHKCKIPVNFGNKYVPPPGKGTGKTSRGFFMLQDGYTSQQSTFKGGRPRSRGYNALHMRGLNGGVNDNALKRSVVFHRASYFKKKNKSSAGCPAFDPELFEDLKKDLPGSMLYIHTIEDEKRKQPDC